jgi:hypothetical protein
MEVDQNRHLGAHDLSAHETLRVYFDSGVHSARRGVGPRAKLGWAIFAEDARRGSQPLQVGLARSGLGGAIGYWHPEGRALLDRVDETIKSYPFTRGSQLYDLVAAHGALRQLQANDYRGKVRMLGDGKEVIEFLRGRDQALHFEVAGQDLARVIREQIRSTARDFWQLTWKWVPTNDNWADPILRRLDHQLGRYPGGKW